MVEHRGPFAPGRAWPKVDRVPCLSLLKAQGVTACRSERGSTCARVLKTEQLRAKVAQEATRISLGNQQQMDSNTQLFTSHTTAKTMDTAASCEPRHGSLRNFTVIDSSYGPFIVNRYCTFQAEALIKTGRPHIEGELQKILKIISTLPLNCVIVDGGANIGLISIPVAHAIREKDGVVHAFEVQRMLFYGLCGAAALNDLENLQAYRMGLGKAKAVFKVPLLNYSVPMDFGAVSLVDQDNSSSTDDVEIASLDDLALPGLDFLKLDIEGMEIDALKGARRMIEQHLPWCWIEYDKVGPGAIKEQFKHLDYKFFLADRRNMVCVPVVRPAANLVNATEIN
jgi:FkbM family methyltransferase